MGVCASATQTSDHDRKYHGDLIIKAKSRAFKSETGPVLVDSQIRRTTAEVVEAADLNGNQSLGSFSASFLIRSEGDEKTNVHCDPH